MKRYALVALAIILLCILSSTAFANAASSTYGFTNYLAINAANINGVNNSDEWYDASVPPSLPTSFAFREKWTYPNSQIYQQILIEFFNDNTNNTGDYYQICWDNSANSGAAPQTDDVKIEWVGHSVSGLHVYTGTGTGWALYTGSDAAYGSNIIVGESLSSSPLNSTSHWVFEMQVYRAGIFDVSSSGYAPGVSVAVYDANNSAAGVQAWPPNSVNNPNNWALETGTMNNIPESLSIIAVVLLSSVAIVAGAVLLRKQPKTEKYNAAKLAL